MPGRSVPPPVLCLVLSPRNRIYGRGLGYITRGQSRSYPVDVFINLQLLSLRPRPREGEPHVPFWGEMGLGGSDPFVLVVVAGMSLVGQARAQDGGNRSRVLWQLPAPPSQRSWISRNDS